MPPRRGCSTLRRRPHTRLHASAAVCSARSLFFIRALSRRATTVCTFRKSYPGTCTMKLIVSVIFAGCMAGWAQALQNGLGVTPPMVRNAHCGSLSQICKIARTSDLLHRDGCKTAPRDHVPLLRRGTAAGTTARRKSPKRASRISRAISSAQAWPRRATFTSTSTRGAS